MWRENCLVPKTFPALQNVVHTTPKFLVPTKKALFNGTVFMSPSWTNDTLYCLSLTRISSPSGKFLAQICAAL